MRRWLVTVGILSISTILLFTGTMVVHAELGSIGANPANPREDNERTNNIFIHTIKPGDEAEDGVRVYNYTKEQRTVEVKAVDSILSSDGSFSCRQSAEKKKDVGAWTALETEKVVIKPESHVIVPFTIVVPKGASPGEHGGCITVQDTKNFASTTGGGVQLGFRNAIRMAVTVTGNLVKKLTIQRIDIKRVDTGNYTVSPVAKNEGNVSLDVTARAQLKSLFGSKTEIKSSDYPIIAGATTGWPFEFKRPFWGGFYKSYTSLSYNADPAAGLGEGGTGSDRVSKQSGYFFMIPAPLAIAAYVAAIVLPCILLAIWLWRRKKSKKSPETNVARVSKQAWVPHTIQPGDTISQLAESHNISWKKLAKKNGLRPPYTLAPGQIMQVPSTAAALPTPDPQPQALASEPAQTYVVPLSAPAGPVLPPQPAQTRTQPVADPTPAPSTNLHWTSPRESSYAEQSSAQQSTNPQYVPTQFPEYYQEHQPAEYEVPGMQNGWSSPLHEHKGYINDANLVPELRSLWDQDADSSPKTPVPLKKKSKPRTKRTKKDQ